MLIAVRPLRVAHVRVALRSVKSVHSLRRSPSRAQSTSAGPPKAGGTNSGLIGGLAGGAVVLGLGYGYYHYSGAKTAVDSITNTKQYVESASKQLTEGSLDSKQAVQWLRTTANQYAVFIPGAKGFLEQGFKELDAIQNEHGEELNNLVNNAQTELQGLVNKGGLDADTAKNAWEIIVKYVQKIQGLATDIGKDILEKHPQLKEQYGDKLNQLKEMSEKQGEETQKYVDETWSKIQDTIKKGNLDKDKIEKLIQDAMDKVQGYGDKAWEKAMEAAKPYLDKNPDVKKIIEENVDQLRKEDLGGLVAKLKAFAESGDPKPIKEWAENQLGKLQSIGDDAWKVAMTRASLYLDKNPELKKIVDEKADVLKKVDIEELMGKLREAGKTGDIAPVKDYIQKKSQELKK